MDYLFSQIKKILQQLRNAKHIFFFSDYDGTLTSIVSHPEKAHLPEEIKDLLVDLKKIPKVHLTIVSGRSLKDIRSKVGLRGIYYVGNHGLEIFKPRYGTKRLFPTEVIPELKKISNRFHVKLTDLEGIFIENKGCILTIHYRNVNPRSIPSILTALKKEVKDSPVSLCLGRGKKVFEIRPNSNVDKGTAVLELLGQSHPDGVIPIYIGDDETDEDAFRVLKNGKGITVSVGRRGHSLAKYYVKDPSEVYQFLKMIGEEFG